MYAPFDPGYPADLAQREQDLEEAKSLLKQAGAEGLTVELVTSDAVGGGAVEAAQVFAENAKGADVKVNVKKVDAGIFYGEDYLSWTFAMDFWYTRNYLAQAGQGTMPSAPYNETHWKNDKWLAIVNEAFRTVDEAKRNELIAEASTIEYEEGGYIIWSFNNQTDAYSEKVAGLTPDKGGDPVVSGASRTCTSPEPQASTPCRRSHFGATGGRPRRAPRPGRPLRFWPSRCRSVAT